RRAKIPAHFAIGAARPDPSGRGFLALLACRAEDLSPRRFAEYLSLAPMPKENVAAEAAPRPLMPRADLFGALLEGEPTAKRMRREQASEGARVPARSAPIGWERLLTKASIVGRKERWAERLAALEKAFERELALLRRRDPNSPRIETVEREIEALSELTRFALPLVEALASLPDLGSWGVWIEELGKLARMALEEPEDVLSALFELAPMAELPAVSFDEVRRVLEGRLGSRVTPPSGRRYGAVFVGTPELARGRSFAVVFVPGLAERLFPEAPREDPILLDGDRRVISKALRTQADRSRNERLLLRLSVGAARERVHLSYPRVEVAAGRPRVPSFYGLDVRRATTGTLPDHDALERDAASASGARLAWPAPAQPEDAIDDAEHDLAMLGRLLHGGEEAEAAGRAQYLLDLNPHLARSLRARSARWDKPVTHHDGIVRKTAATAAVLAASRLRVRPYAVTALEKFAACPYRFLLAAIHRLPARERRGSPDRLDPISRGVLFHRVQAETLAALEREGALPFGPDGLSRAEAVLDERLDAAAREHEERTLPPVESVFRDEIERARVELHAWLARVADQSWLIWPVRYDLAFGLPPHEHEDPRSVVEAALIEGQYLLHGAIDVVERHAATGHARVTDVKTGANFARPGLVIDGGEVLQPVLYGLAYEAVWKEPVADASLSFCTARGGYAEHVIELDEAARAKAVHVLSLVDEAIDKGFFPPAPRPGACETCGYRLVCGPHEERRAARKDEDSLDGGALFTRLRLLRGEP
ncbi:MAG TPA: PD-(D/E)XK nuclease family protein, partial [Polyangium sp.]|nr:PD-(D/E)XK nuclease family protein [Polyangium sp.]